MFKKFIFTTLISAVFLLSGCSEESKVKGNILDGKAAITFPENFSLMSDSQLQKKYPADSRPGEAYQAENGKVTFAFNLTENKISEDQLSLASEAMKAQLEEFSPELTEVKINGHKAVMIEMTTPDPDSDDLEIKNVMLISSLNGKLLISTFNTTSDLEEKYLTVGKKALETISY
ncbi:hypothetical protein I2494_01160 [Budviciaceae bacterium BWR-B9]|uniref:DUF1795 domain-containing protein n=1 Tax=Limnobaculum allomyrinae TaxID=2791986 RepID=A0ABS1IKS1_9GAMM|nr:MULTISPECIES: hypothetical protein [Limnobaculum]MBK5142343.1 hypothetical protein [Limnobaculum allomyrinae]MBV7690772.1 hypothetical protein [Limnobaculum sp. M2-1]